MADSARMVSEHKSAHRSAHEESVREMEQIRHTNATIEGQDQRFHGQTESADIRIVTPIFKTTEIKSGSEVKTGADVADLNAKFERAGADYKAERMAEQFRLQIIDPKVVDHAYIPAHGPRDYTRKKLMEDFPSLHGKRSFLNLDNMEQRKLRQSRPMADVNYTRIPDAKPWAKPALGPRDDENIRELDRLRSNIDQLHKARPIPRVESKTDVSDSTGFKNHNSFGESTFTKGLHRSSTAFSSHIERNSSERALVKTELPPLPVCKEIRREVVEVVKPKTSHKVHRVEERKRTEEVERRIIRRERRHKSRKTHYSSHSGGHHGEYHDWHGTNGFRSGSASRGGYGYTNGFSSEHHLPISYESGRRGLDSSSDRYFKESRSGSRLEDRGYGSLSDSLRRGDIKYGANGDVSVKANRVHKAHSTRDVFYRDGDRFSSRRDPAVDYPPSLPRSGYADSPSRTDDFGSSGYRALTKARSYTDWGQRDDMAKLEHEFRDAQLMRLPDGKVSEREYQSREIPGGYETYERETKADSGRRVLDGVPTDFSEGSRDFHFKRETQK